MQFKQTLASQQQSFLHQLNTSSIQQPVIKNIGHYTKSECPSPNERMINDRKG